MILKGRSFDGTGPGAGDPGAGDNNGGFFTRIGFSIPAWLIVLLIVFFILWLKGKNNDK